MTDGDDKLLRHYRELPRDEPPHELDAAILAASRRAVQARPWSKRFAGPVSIAAVLVLAVGISLNMQREQPGVEMAPAVPDASPKDAFANTPAEVAPPAKPQAKSELRALKKDAIATPPAAARARVEVESLHEEPRAFSAAPAAAPMAPAAANEASVMRDAQVAAFPDPAAELERIAKLRSDGRTEEADKALGAFLAKHPGYKIPDALWDRVKAR